MSSPNTSPAAAAPTTTTSNKRAHEDSISQNAPEAKRPALDPESKQESSASTATVKTEPVHAEKTPPVVDAVAPVPEASSPVDTKNAVVKKEEAKDEQGDVSVPDAPQQQQPQQPQGVHQQQQQQHQEQYVPVDESKWIHIRAIISSQEAATVIGKGGENVTMIRRMSAAKCTVSDYARGAVERILTVSGSVDAVAKVTIRQTA